MWKVTSYLTHVPPLRHGRCWQTGGSQFSIFRPLTASPITSLSFESTRSFPMQPTNLLDPSPAPSGVSQWDDTAPRNIGPNVPCEEGKKWINLMTLVLAVCRVPLRTHLWTKHIQSTIAVAHSVFKKISLQIIMSTAAVLNLGAAEWKAWPWRVVKWVVG